MAGCENGEFASWEVVKMFKKPVSDVVKME